MIGRLVAISGSLDLRYLKIIIGYDIIKKQEGGVLKIIINTDGKSEETEIVIYCNALTSEIQRIISALRLIDNQITVTKDTESYILDVSQIIYIEYVDRKTFVYTAKDCFETKLRLYELEERLCSCGFLRTSKSGLVQLKYVRSIKSEIDRKLRLTLDNGEQLIVSRQYADELKRRLGVK